MKKTTVVSVLALSLLFSCKKNDNNAVIAPVTTDTLANSITADITLNANTKYVINGQVFVKNNTTLTIPAGTTISVVPTTDRTAKGVLVITQGSKLVVNGTLDKPVVFTSAAASKAPGDWGGIIINGKAPTNIVSGNAAGLAISDDTKYGGTVTDDNSGSLKYLRLEYCGGINPDAEDEWAVDKVSGLCFESVGSGTMVDNIMVTHSKDDGFQFVGGTVNATHLIAYNNGDDDFDFDLGYEGKLQYLLSYRTELTSTHALRANGIETYNDATPTSNKPYTRPVFSNVTIIGPQGMETTKTNLNQGVYIRKGTRFTLQNSIVAEYPQGGLMVCNKTRPILLAGVESQFKYNMVHSDSVNKTFSWDQDYRVIGDSILQKFALSDLNSNVLITNTDDFKFKSMYAANGPDLSLAPGAAALTGANFDAADYNNFFEKVPYRGAFGTTNWAIASNWAVWK